MYVFLKRNIFNKLCFMKELRVLKNVCSTYILYIIVFDCVLFKKYLLVVF